MDSRLGVYSRDEMFVDDGSVTLDGQLLGDMGWYLTAPPSVDSASFRTSFTSVTGAHGSRDMTLVDSSGLAFADRRNVTLSIRTVGTYQEATASKLALGGYIGREVRVRWRILPGAFIGRLSASEPSEVWVRGVFSHYELTLTLEAQPLLLGDLVSAASGALSIDGNVRVYPTIECTASSASVRVTAPDMTYVALAGLKSGTKVRIVCADDSSRGAFVNGVRILPTIDSDFFSLEPGNVTLAITGGSINKVTYEPLWLIP